MIHANIFSSELIGMSVAFVAMVIGFFVWVTVFEAAQQEEAECMKPVPQWTDREVYYNDADM